MSNKMPSWAKMLVGICGILALAKWTPILDLMYLFLMVVIIPWVFLACIGLVSWGTVETTMTVIRSVMEDAKRRARELAQKE
jgi:hypothetical protein